MKKKSIFPFIFLLSGLLFCSSINNVSAQCTENFDGVTGPALPVGWSAVTLTDCTGSNPWITSTATPNSAPNSAFVTAPGCVSDEVLVSRYFSITIATAQLTFSRKHDLELNWDGLVLEISIDGGSFVDILAAGGSFTAGGYNATLNSTGSNPIRGRQAWTGSTSNAFVTTIVNLPSSAIGKIIVLRWRRGTDASGSGTGAFIDNITMTGCSTSACAENFDGVTGPALPSGWIAATALDCATSNPWATQSSVFNTAPNAAFVNDPDCVSDEYLYSKIFQIVSTTAQIVFRRNHILETNYDGMVLEISIGGTAFKDIIAAGCTFVSGNYSNNVISTLFESPLAWRDAWTGDSGGWITTTINLPATGIGKSVVLRWRRGTDNSQSGSGAYIDGLTISGSLCNPVCATNIILTPAGGSFCSNSQFLLTASVAGAVYEWYRDDVKINGVTGNTYTATTPGIYYVRSVIGGCLVTSNVAVLESVPTPPVISGTGVYCAGSLVSITTTVTDVTQKYIFKKNGVAVSGLANGHGGGLIYQFNMSTAGDYVLEATKPGCTTVVSNIVSVRLPEPVTGLTTVKVCPQDATIKWNRIIPGYVSQNYEYYLSQSSTPPSSGTPTIDSAVTVTVSPSTLYYFYVRSSCIVSGTGSWASISFTAPALSSNITLSPASGSVCNNTISLAATGSTGGAYEWYRNNILIDGVAGSSYNANSGGTYTVKSVVNGCTITSNNAVITETIMTSPSLAGEGVYCTGALVDLRSTTVPTQQYAWYLNGTLRQGPIGGGNGGNQSLPVTLTSADVGDWVVISSKSGCGNVTSNTVIVNEAKVKNLHTTLICPNQVTFEWDYIAAGENYQYVVNQSSTPPANPVNPSSTSSTGATVSSLVPSTAYYIHVRAASGPNFTSFCPVWTSISFITAAAFNPLAVSPASGTVCNNALTLTATGGSVYEWYRNDILIDGETGAFYNASSGGTYTVKSVVNGCTNVSNNSVISENTMTPHSLAVNGVSGDGVYCIGTPLDIRSTTVPTQNYAWYLNGTLRQGPIGGGNGGNQSLPIAAMAATDKGDWKVISTRAGCGNVESNIVHVDEARVENVGTIIPICPTVVSFYWTPVASGERYQYVVTQSGTPPANPVNPVVTSGLTATVSSLTPSTAYYFHIRAASGPDFTTFCSAWTTKPFTTISNSLPPTTAVWIGTADNVWTNAANWQCGLLPGTTSAVIISSYSIYFPVITSNVTVRSLTVNPGASLQVNTGVVITVTSQ